MFHVVGFRDTWGTDKVSKIAQSGVTKKLVMAAVAKRVMSVACASNHRGEFTIQGVACKCELFLLSLCDYIIYIYIYI